VIVQANKLERHALDQSSVEDNFRTAIGALHDYNLVEHRRVETAGSKGHFFL
jgi:hypothetical protein